MNEPFEAGCVVVCEDDSGVERFITKGEEYYVMETNSYGFIVYLDVHSTEPFSRERFRVLYSMSEYAETEDKGPIHEC